MATKPLGNWLILGDAGTGKTNFVFNLIYDGRYVYDEIMVMTYPHDEPIYIYLQKTYPNVVIIHDLKDLPPRTGKKRLEIYDEVVHDGGFFQENCEFYSILKSAKENNTSWVATEFNKRKVPIDIQDLADNIVEMNFVNIDV